MEDASADGLVVAQDLQGHEQVVALQLGVGFAVVEHVQLAVLAARLEQVPPAGRHLRVAHLVVVRVQHLPRLLVVVQEDLDFGVFALHQDVVEFRDVQFVRLPLVELFAAEDDRFILDVLNQYSCFL